MPGIFGGLADAVGGAEQFADDEHRKKELERQADQANAINRAATLAALANAGVVPGAQRAMAPNTVAPLHGTIATPPPMDSGTGMAQVQPAGAAMVLPTTHNLTSPDQVDADRYTPLGDTGLYQDKSKTADAITARNVAMQQRLVDRRVATLKATRPELKNVPDDQVRGIAEDDKAFGEYMKPVNPDFTPIPGTDSTLVDKTTGNIKPTGQPVRPLPPVEGSPEWVKAQGDAAAARAAGRASAGSPSGNAPISAADRARVALDQRIAGVQHQIAGTRDDQRAEQTQYAAATKAIDPDSANTAGAFQVQRKHSLRAQALKNRLDSLNGVSDSLNNELGKTVPGSAAPSGGLNLQPVGPKAGTAPTTEKTPPPQTQDEYNHLIQAGMTDAQIVARYGPPAPGIVRRAGQ